MPPSALARPVGVPQPYKAVAITPPTPMTDAGFESFRKQLGEAAQRKDRAALTRLVVDQGFFWDHENRIDKRKSSIDNLSTVLGLNNKDGVGWEILFSYADDPTASPSTAHKGAFCAPAEPAYNAQEFDDLLKTTQTDVTEWGYPVSAGIEVHAAPQATAPVIDKLGLAFVRVSPDDSAPSANYVRVVTPAGKAGYVSADAHRADRQRSALLRQGRRRLEDRRLYRRRRAAITGDFRIIGARACRPRPAALPARAAARRSTARSTATAGARPCLTRCRCRPTRRRIACARPACARRLARAATSRPPVRL